MTTDTLAELATTTLADILRDPEAPLAARQRAAADALRHVAAERNRDLARERLAARRAHNTEAPAAPADCIDLAPFPPEQREILLECARQLLEHGGPDPVALEELDELEDADIDLEDDDLAPLETDEPRTIPLPQIHAPAQSTNPSG